MSTSTKPKTGGEDEFILNAAIYERTQILVGNEGIQRLHAANVLLVGVGGVGGHCAEALVRAGVGHMTIVDGDVVSATNKNRQLIALDSTIGKSKVDALAARLQDVSSHCQVTSIDGFLLPEDVDDILDNKQPDGTKGPKFNYVVDCIDSVECKFALLDGALQRKMKVFASGGAGGRLDPSRVKICDLFETENDALSRMVRQEMRARGYGPGDITVAHSDEKGLPGLVPQRQENGGRDRAVNGTVSYMPPLFGLMLSAAVIRHIIDPVGEEKALKQKLKKMAKQTGGGGGGGNGGDKPWAAKRDAKLAAAQPKAKQQQQQQQGGKKQKQQHTQQSKQAPPAQQPPQDAVTEGRALSTAIDKDDDDHKQSRPVEDVGTEPTKRARMEGEQ